MRSFNPFDKGPLCDPVSLGMGAVGMVGNVAGGIFGSSAAKKAGDIQNAAAQAAAADIKNTTNSVNPQITAAAQAAAQQVSGASGQAADNVSVAADAAGAGARGAATSANALLNPYATAGTSASDTLAAGLVPGGDFNKTPTMADIQIDPGYAFRVQQGEQAQARKAAAGGAALGGGAAKELEQYRQGMASQEYQNAFNRFQTSTQNRFGNLNTVANRGLTAGTQMGSNLIGSEEYAGTTKLNGENMAGNFRVGGAEYGGNAGMSAANTTAANSINAAAKAGDYTTGGAAAKAAGLIGGANAMSAGIGGAINAGQNAVMMNLLKNPATNKSGGRSAPMIGGLPWGGGGYSNSQYEDGDTD